LTTARYNSALHRIALITAVATFPLIFMGGLVTSKQAGMSVPDWPNSYGYNMFLFPPRLWVGNILYEHTHRLMATVVGFLSIVLAITAWFTEKRPWVRKLSFAVLGMVVLQGVLGGLRVVLIKLNLAIVHACVAQAFFCLASLVAVITSRWWMDAPDLSQDARHGRRLMRLGVLTVAVIYAQLVVGAVMRHYQAGLAVNDFPLIYNRVIPPTTSVELAAINRDRSALWTKSLTEHTKIDYAALEQMTAPVSLAQVWVHTLHRYGAIAVSCLVIALVTTVLRSDHQRALVAPAVILLLLLLTQVTLGALTVLLHKPADVASAHVAVGALTLMTAFVLTVRAFRVYSPLYRPQSASSFEVVRPDVREYWSGSLATRA
jgi:cytochrome c oxidase assembly protein subunit 15